MSKENEGADVELDADSTADNGDESTDWKAEALKARGIAKRHETRAAKLERDLESSKGSGTKANDPQHKNDSQPTDLDYGQKAFLRASGIKGPEETQLAKDFMKRTGLDLDAVIEDDIFQAKLDKLRTTKANADAADIRSTRTGEAVGKDTVEYWLSKLGPDDQVPMELSRDLRTKIVDARRKANTDGAMFYNEVRKK